MDRQATIAVNASSRGSADAAKEISNKGTTDGQIFMRSCPTEPRITGSNAHKRIVALSAYQKTLSGPGIPDDMRLPGRPAPGNRSARQSCRPPPTRGCAPGPDTRRRLPLAARHVTSLADVLADRLAISMEQSAMISLRSMRAIRSCMVVRAIPSLRDGAATDSRALVCSKARARRSVASSFLIMGGPAKSTPGVIVLPQVENPIASRSQVQERRIAALRGDIHADGAFHGVA